MGVETVKILLVLRHVGIALESLRHHHHHGVREGTAGCREDFNHVVEVGTIRALHVADGVNQFQFLLAEKAVLEQCRFAAHAVDIACDGVDFTVVRDVAERLGEFPFGRGVGRKPRMHQGECTFEGLLLQVEVIRFELSRGQLPFVDEGLATQ